MRKYSKSAVVLLQVLLAPFARAADVTQDAPNITTKSPNKGKLVASEFCPFGTIGSPVGVAVDDLNRVFVTETRRRTNGEVDIRQHYDYLAGSLAARSVEDKRAFLHANYHNGPAGDANKDGVEDWKDLLCFTEVVHRLVDTNADGKYDEKTVFAENFATEITGVAGGVLAFGPHVYTTIQPDLWRLTDVNNDGVADQRKTLSHGHGVHIGFGGHDMHGPVMGPDGRVYWSQGDKGYNITSADGKNFAHPYEGAVFRVDPDGSNLEVFAYGLRNPQELAFDDYGNLFSVDNDADLGDRERFVYILENSDTGWRATYQYRNRKQAGVTTGGYNPWMAEELWKTKFDTQTAYILPALANYSDGPCGFKYNPGTALSDEYRGHFFVTQFPKKLLTAFKAQPDGAGFKMTNEHVAHSGLMLTGLAIGADGALYAADWGENAWAPHQQGRVAKIDVPGAGPRSALRVETQRLLAEGMDFRHLDELTEFLSHPDQRVRLRAQFELVARKQGLMPLIKTAVKNDSQLARIHAIWGLGELARMATALSPFPGTPGEGRGEGRAPNDPTTSILLNLLTDPDPEIRAQSAKVLADARHLPAADPVAALLNDPSPRTRSIAAIALSKLGNPAHLDALVNVIAANKSKDTHLRTAATIALAGAAATAPEKLAALSTHANRNLRLAAVVALRRLASPLVAPFLNDADEWVIAEVARAIHDDTSIPAALPALAKLLARAPDAKLTNEPTLRRAISANLRLGDAASAHRLVAYATSNAPTDLRAEALLALAEFARPDKLDRVQGYYRDLGQRDPALAHAALDPAINPLLADPHPAVRNATVNAIRQLGFDAAKDRLARIALDAAQPATVRAPALQAIAALKSPQTRQAVALALESNDARLRATALTVLAQLDPGPPATLATLQSALAGRSIPEQQAALDALGTLKSKEATAALTAWVDRLITGDVPPPLQLDVLEAAAARKDKQLTAKVETYRSSKPKNDLLAASIESLEGGDAAEGELIFKSGQCTQCHLVNGSGGNVGPDLTHVATRLSRRDLLESIVAPNAKIAEGFTTISVTTKDNDTITGTIQSQSATELTLKDADGQLIKLNTDDIESRAAPTTAMPPMTDVLKPAEIRHVVEYLSTLK